MTRIRQILEQAAYTLSVHNRSQLPPDAGIEVAVAGRSNSGKSSLINRLCRRKALARTSRTPGRTQQLVFFDLDEERRLVDLPGYGYAAVGADLKRHWQGLIQGYLESRQALAGLVQVMDIRHPLKEGDIQLAEFALHRGLALHVVLTKADKLGHGKRTETVRRVREALGGVATVQVFSATSGLGVEELERVMAAWLQVEPG
ncbi:MAG: YihA family ribosome biogenesis GTP-binding protein [Wenzhouxiangellaceae bacterium]|jgi:GTP-binding protein|nr:YihA family ribosome biogenesis GTP-binding protein [Wenzhouxiangellaceae bacterium]MBS3747056.1 YihA family ribosome biogenesis GTP-binding protein [Wenzhouxiangellaceae bacterium]MBS3823832.1 YihA family ribosome biogenesis GTP-binding protein [Wenzhouxiangellaceae bacterium]